MLASACCRCQARLGTAVQARRVVTLSTALPLTALLTRAFATRLKKSALKRQSPSTSTRRSRKNALADDGLQAMPSPSLTPMQSQWRSMKDAHPGHILLFRLGDFYEMFEEDAVVAASVLSLTLTSRHGVAMCGFPYFALPTHLRKFLAAEHTVAISDQSHSTSSDKAQVVDRNIMRIVTPGTSVDDGVDSPRQFNFLVALAPADADSYAITGPVASLAWIDVSTGMFETCTVSSWSAASSELARLNPTELLIPSSLKTRFPQSAGAVCGYRTTVRDDKEFNGDMTQHIERWQGVEAVTDESIDTEDATSIDPATTGVDSTMSAIHPRDLLLRCAPIELRACSAVLSYLAYTQRFTLPRLFTRADSARSSSSVMQIDATTRRSLELNESLSRGTRVGSLIHAIDSTATNSGARLLSSWLASPLTDIATIHARLDLVELFYNDRHLLDSIRSQLKACEDIERGLQRLVMRKGGGGARELRAIAETIIIGNTVAQSLRQTLAVDANNSNQTIQLQSLVELLSSSILLELASLLNSAIVDDPPALLDSGHFIRSSYHAPLAHLHKLTNNSHDAIDELQRRYRDELNLPALKIKKNAGIGFFIEVSGVKARELEDRRRSISTESKGPSLLGGLQLFQQLKNEFRYKSREMNALQDHLMTAHQRAIEAEFLIFEQLRDRTLKCSALLASFAQALAKVDVLGSLANTALDHAWTRPMLVQSQSPVFDCEGGRHPVVEMRLARITASDDPHLDFTANSCQLGGASHPRVWLITGPNMSGKSTFLRQNALIALLASIGSFVPAERLTMSPIDAIFSRIGGSVTDDLSRAQSTFMAEMSEIAAILNRATSHSLVIVDECGRGTSTFDGLAIAHATLEYMHDVLQCRTLFATHYHEIAIAAPQLASLSCHRMAVTAHNDNSEASHPSDEANGASGSNLVTFLHRVEPGVVNASYGINVARLAGLPEPVTARATSLLNKLEAGRRSYRAMVSKVLASHSHSQ